MKALETNYSEANLPKVGDKVKIVQHFYNNVADKPLIGKVGKIIKTEDCPGADYLMYHVKLRGIKERGYFFEELHKC